MYNEGDDPRFIDWNVYARTDRTYIKRFLGDTNSHLMILLDASASMGFGGPPVSKLRYAQFVAASLAFLAARQHDAVGCMVFDEEVRDYREPSTRSGKMQGVLHCLDSATPSTGTRFDKPFDKFREQINRRGLVAVISDFYCDIDELLAGVRPLAWQGQDVVLFQVLDSQELDPEFKSNVLLEDLETGEAIEVEPQFMREHYPQRIRSHVDALQKAPAVSARITFSSIPTIRWTSRSATTSCSGSGASDRSAGTRVSGRPAGGRAATLAASAANPEF